ncbi:MAG: hypothetical protein CL859_07365 [Cyanobium sp. ARS6]|nr:hypothetical protein [Cyanobium sp. ARS6]
MANAEQYRLAAQANKEAKEIIQSQKRKVAKLEAKVQRYRQQQVSVQDIRREACEARDEACEARKKQREANLQHQKTQLELCKTKKKCVGILGD